MIVDSFLFFLFVYFLLSPVSALLFVIWLLRQHVSTKYWIDFFEWKANAVYHDTEHVSQLLPICSSTKYRGADKSLARPTSRCILFDGENISFHASLVIYIYK